MRKTRRGKTSPTLWDGTRRQARRRATCGSIRSAIRAWTPISPRSAIGKAIESVQPHATRKDIAIADSSPESLPPVLGDEAKQFFKDRIARYLAYADKQLAGKDYLMGSQFTVADGYLFVILNWAERMKIDTSAFPNLNAFKARVAARPKVQAALQNAHAGAGAGVPWGLAVSIASSSPGAGVFTVIVSLLRCASDQARHHRLALDAVGLAAEQRDGLARTIAHRDVIHAGAAGQRLLDRFGHENAPNVGARN